MFFSYLFISGIFNFQVENSVRNITSQSKAACNFSFFCWKCHKTFSLFEVKSEKLVQIKLLKAWKPSGKIDLIERIPEKRKKTFLCDQSLRGKQLKYWNHPSASVRRLDRRPSVVVVRRPSVVVVRWPSWKHLINFV